jgi:2-dehydro-3-deoxyphosphogalactonate aldolase
MTEPAEILNQAMARCPLVAILRGVRPDEVGAIADALVDAGFAMIEVPLNSPDPLASIALLAKRYGPDVVIGAGTVLNVAEVGAMAAAGGRLIVSPNVDPAVIRASVAAGLVSLPGYFTPSEAFVALGAGAHGLKLFPAEAASPAVLKAQRAVLPAAVPLLAVGGVGVDNLGAWMAAGAQGAGLGSGLYKPGMTAHDVADRARAFVEAVKAR